jgi:hypothetical protein
LLIFFSSRQEYADLVTEEMMENDDSDDSFYESMVNSIDSLLEEMKSSVNREEL